MLIGVVMVAMKGRSCAKNLCFFAAFLLFQTLVSAQKGKASPWLTLSGIPLFLSLSFSLMKVCFFFFGVGFWIG